MRGWLDTVADGRIVGWIFDERPGAPEPSVTVLVNGKPVTEGFVTTYRVDVAEAGFGSGMAGFMIPFLANHHLNLKCAVQVVETKTGWVIPPGDVTFDPGGAIEDALDVGELEARLTLGLEASYSALHAQQNIGTLGRLYSRAVAKMAAILEAENNAAAETQRAIVGLGGAGKALAHLSAQVRDHFPPITIDRVAAPTVSLIIPVRDEFASTYACIRSLVEHRQKHAFEIIIVDDLSTDETLLSSIVFFGEVSAVRNQRHLCFAGACNTGAATARGRLLFFLHNDTRVQGAWLDPLVEAFADERVAIVGPRLLAQDQNVQECGGSVTRDAHLSSDGKGADPRVGAFRHMRPADYVSGAALMVRADLFREWGGFDGRFEPRGYEDVDLAFRARQAGYQVLAQPASTIMHLGNPSDAVPSSWAAAQARSLNRTNFLRKWHKELRDQHRLGDSGQNPRRALFVDLRTPTPDRDAGSNVAIEHMLALRRLGYHVVFAPTADMVDIPFYTAQLESHGVECVYAPEYLSLPYYLANAEPDFDIIYFHRFPNADQFMDQARRRYPDATIIYSVADLHALREAREQRLYGVAAPKAAPASAVRDFELINQADVVIVHSTFELEIIRREAPRANAHCITWPLRVNANPPGFEERSGIGFVGGYEHQPNVDAMLWFTEAVLPLARARDKRLVMHMLGSHMPDILKRLNSPTLRATGYVEDIAAFVGGFKATVAPLRYGAGLKGKVLTSFASGTPCVMSSIAAEGMALPDALRAYVADAPEAMTSLITTLTTDSQKWREASEAALEFIAVNFSKDRIDAALKAAIESALH